MSKRIAGLVAVAIAAAVAAITLYLVECRHAPLIEKAGPATDAAPAAPSGPTPAKSAEAAPPVQAAPTWTLEDDPSGPLRLEGQVLDEGDKGVGGALVVLDSRPRRTATTEADGSFAFDKLVGRTYTLTARADGRVGGPVVHKLAAGSDPVAIRLRAAGRLSVTVVAADGGKPIAGATIGVNDDPGLTATTGKDGKASLAVPDGYLIVAASATGHATSKQLVEIPHGTAVPVETTIALQGGASIAGRVVDDAGKPVAGAEVGAHDASQAFGFGGATASATTDKEGRFILAAVAAGTFRLTATHPDHAAGTSPTIATSGTSPISGVEIKLKAAATVAGRVVDRKQQPVPYATVRLSPQESGISFEATEALRQVVADERGRFRFRGLPRAKLKALAVGELGSSLAQEVDLTAKPSVEDQLLELTVEGIIAGTVVDEKGEPVAEAQVSALPDFFAGGSGAMNDFALRGMAGETTDSAGRFSFHGLPDAPYTLRASRSALRPNQFLLGGEKAHTGDTAVRLVLATDGAITGKLAYAEGGAPTSFTVAIGFPPGTPFAPEDGAFRLPEVPPGTYDVTFRGADFAETVVRDVVVGGGASKDIGTVTVKRGRALTGRVVDAGGAPVAGATVVVGKQILGDGRSLTTDLGAGAAEYLGLRKTTTGTDGTYRLSGLVDGQVYVAAEHADRGRSPSMPVPVASGVQTIDLQLRPFGSVEGTVTVSGKPAAGGQLIVAAKSGAAGQMILVQIADGSFVVDKIPVGVYHLTAMISSDVSGGADVTVLAGQRAHATVAIETGEIKLRVGIKARAGADLAAAQIFLFRGVVSVANGGEVQDAALTGGLVTLRPPFVTPSEPVLIENIVPGTHTLCGLPITGPWGDTTFNTRVQTNAATLKVYCQRIEIGPAPLEQLATIELPSMEPLPEPPKPPAPKPPGSQKARSRPLPR